MKYLIDLTIVGHLVCLQRDANNYFFFLQDQITLSTGLVVHPTELGNSYFHIILAELLLRIHFQL